MNEPLETIWEKEIDALFAKNPHQAQYLIEHSWQLYRDYFLAYLQPYLTNAVGKKVLDIGCGSGLVTKELLGRGLKVHGVDFSTKAIAFAQQQYPGIHFQQASLYQLPFSDSMFDIISCLGVMQTTADHRRAISEMKRVLRSGGVLMIRTLNAKSVSSKKSQHQNPLFNFYNPLALATELEAMGLSVVSLQGAYLFPWPLGFFNRVVFKTKLYFVFNLLFAPFFRFFSHSFFITCIKR